MNQPAVLSVPAEVRALQRLGDWVNYRLNSSGDLARVTRLGVAPDAVERLMARGFSRKDLGWIVPARTLSHRQAKQENLNLEESGRWLRAAKILALAEEVLGSQEQASRWLHKPRQAFDGLSALEAMQTEAGGRWVEEHLLQLDAGYAA